MRNSGAQSFASGASVGKMDTTRGTVSVTPPLMTSHTTVQTRYLARSALTAGETISSGEQLLAVIDYGALEPPQASCPVASVALRQLGGPSLCEVWTSSVPIERGRYSDIEFASNDEVLFGVYQGKEPDVLLDRFTHDIYGRITRLAMRKGYPHLLRMWNYFGDIDGEQAGVGRYQRFCIGRYQAFAESKVQLEKYLPAASVIGNVGSTVTIYFVAARDPGTPVENPRQVSAFRYPPQYSPQSPSFSRAMLKTWTACARLYVSGTASIVGHATMHAGDITQQLSEILQNLQALLVHASRIGQADLTSASATLLKVYLRHAGDCSVVQKRLTRLLGSVPALYLQGEFCRRDLLLEIEGIYERKRSAGVAAA
jgi:chorismate lyase/3-hydroxybenzoate synthase